MSVTIGPVSQATVTGDWPGPPPDIAPQAAPSLRPVAPEELEGLCTDESPTLEEMAEARRRGSGAPKEHPTVDIPRAPDAFVEWLASLDRLPTPNPFTEQEVEALVDRMKADMSAAAEIDALSRDSLPHISMHRTLVRRFTRELAQLGLDPEYICLLGNAHDMGKFVPDAEVLREANGDFLTGRVAWHDQSTASYLLDLGEELELAAASIQHLIVDIVGINEGSGEKDAFWNAHLWGNGYPLPRSLEGEIAALFDRFGQGDPTGALKILKQNDLAGVTFRENVTQSYRDNPATTLRQIERIGTRIEEEFGIEGFRKSKIMEAARAAQTETLQAWQRIHWDGDIAVIPGKDGRMLQAANAEELGSPEIQQLLFGRSHAD